jgi:hypothetical protein
VVIATDPDLEREVPAMDFRLTFDGLLLSTGNKGRPAHVHIVRRRFHPQPRHLWSVDPSINVTDASANYQIKERSEKFAWNNYNFVPLVTKDHGLVCALDILLLRPKPSSTIIQKGDIDGQLKTLFDALSLPQHGEQLGENNVPSDDEKPFFCLLEDDALITSVAVETGILLEDTRDGLDRNAARAVIRARVYWPPRDLGYAKSA